MIAALTPTPSSPDTPRRPPRCWPSLLVASVLLAGAARGIAVFPATAKEAFDPCASTALFVGFRDFKSLARIPYAVDDAMDLAHLFSIELNLVCPENVHVLHRGKPQNREARRRRKELKEGGAHIRVARTAEEVLNAVRAQARGARSNGLFILAFATHGISSRGQAHYLMAPFSSLENPEETGVSRHEILDILAEESRAAAHIVLIDACRQRLVRTPRAATAPASPDPRSAMTALLPQEVKPAGQAIFLAAPPGGYACDDEDHENGIFTAAVIAALQCGAVHDARGYVTNQAVASFVERRVEERAPRYECPSPYGIEYHFASKAGDMALASCPRPIDPRPREIGKILEPAPGAQVGPVGLVRVRVFEAGLYAAVLIRPLSDGSWWVQNDALPAFPDADLPVQVHYGGPDRFQIFVALTEDPSLFRTGQRLTQIPMHDTAGRPVRWLTPVEVEAVYDQ